MFDRNTLSTQGFVQLPYPPELRAAVAAGTSSWKQFCETLGSPTKKEFVYKDKGNMDGAGYELKLEEGDTNDHKENFHVTSGALNVLAETATAIGTPATELIRNSRSILEHINPLVLDFARHLEREYGLAQLYDEVVSSQDNIILRHIHYFGGRAEGDTIGAAHPDKSGFTFHLFEDGPGLQYLEIEPSDAGIGRRWLPLPISSGSMTAITNLQMQYRSRGKTKALWHRVKATKESAIAGRFSMVLFVQLMHTPMLDKVGGVGRAQDLPHGFNYDMTQGDFEKYFSMPQ